METLDIGKHCRVTFLSEVGCVKIEWIDMPTSDEFRNGCNVALELMSEKGVHKFLVDNSKAKLFSIRDQQWLNEEWLPRAEKAGYRYSATFLGQSDAFVKFAVQNIAGKRDSSKFSSKFFVTQAEAVEWLKTV